MDTIYGWLCTNTLSINLTKTHIMVFNKSDEFVIPRIYNDNHLVELTDNVRYSCEFLEEIYKLGWKYKLS